MKCGEKTYTVLGSTWRHIPANKSALATDRVIGGMVTFAISRAIRKLIGVITLTVDSTNMNQIVTLV